MSSIVLSILPPHSLKDHTLPVMQESMWELMGMFAEDW